MGKILAVFAVLLGALVATVVVDRPLPDADLTMIIPLDYNTLDPTRMEYNHDLRLSYAIYEQLVRYDNMSDDFHVVPALARSWDVSPDRLTYTFHMEPSARWSNAEPVRAGDFVYTWQRALMPDTAAAYTTMFFTLKGGEAFFNWREAQLAKYAARPAGEKSPAAARRLREEANQRFRDTVGVKALDDHTLRVTLQRPCAYFLDLCAFGVFSPVYPPLLEQYVSVDPISGRIKQTYEWTKPPLIVTNGPYRVRVWKFKRAMFLDRNPYYWDPTLAKCHTIKIIPITDGNTSVLAYQTGAANWHTDVSVAYIPEMLAEKAHGGRQSIHGMTTFGTYFWDFNCTPTLNDGRPNPFHDPRVRRAFAMAVDKKRIADNVRRTGEPPTDVFIPRGSIGGYHSPDGVHYDPERAKELFAAAGWKDRNGDGIPENEQGMEFPVVDFLYSTTSYHKDIALVLAKMWARTFGVQARLNGEETKVYKDDIKKHNYMVARGGWFGDYGDPTTFLNLFRTGDGNNDSGFSDPHMDALLEKADNEPDPDKRMRVLEEAERYAMDDALPILPLFQYGWWYLYEPPVDAQGRPNPGGLRGISHHPRLVQYLWKLEVVKKSEATGAAARGDAGASANPTGAHSMAASGGHGAASGGGGGASEGSGGGGG